MSSVIQPGPGGVVTPPHGDTAGKTAVPVPDLVLFTTEGFSVPAFASEEWNGASMTDYVAHEHGSAQYSAVIKDQAGVAIAAASLTTLTLTLYNVKGGEIINSRDAQDVLNDNNVTVDSSGNLVWSIQPADNISSGASEIEPHIALFEYTWNAGADRGSHEVLIQVEDIKNVAALA